MRYKKASAVVLSAVMMMAATVSTMATETCPIVQGSLGMEIKKGDVTNDGKINAEDALMGLKVLTGTYQKTTLSSEAIDVNGDGVASVRDVLQILQNAAGLRDDKLGVANLPDVTYGIPEVYQEGSAFLADETVGFYGADGYGKYTQGGRGGRVIYVTNLNDSGEGSLRAALEEKGPRIVVFRVSGNIKLKSQIRIKNGDLTIAGETAPGDGINLLNYPLSLEGANNVIIRYLNMRSGDYQQAMGLYGGGEGGVDSLTISNSKNVIIDHCSAIWGTDETLSITVDAAKGYAGTSDNISVQWTLIANSLVSSPNYPDGYTRLGLGSLIGGCYGSKYSFHHNVYASHASRMPEVFAATALDQDPGGFQYEFVNNVVFNWGGGGASKIPNKDKDGIAVYQVLADFINNYYKPGSGMNNGGSGSDAIDQAAFGTQVYMSGNMMDGKEVANQSELVTFADDMLATDVNPYYTRHGWYLDTTTLKYVGGEKYSFNYLKDESFADSIYENIQTASDTYDDVLKYVGSSLSRDSIDTGLVESIADGTGKLIDLPYQTPGWSTGTPSVNYGKEYGKWLLANYPEAATYTPYTDTDEDGMSDAWEDAVGLDKNDATDGAAKYLNTEYTNLDVFLQFLIENPAAAIQK